MEVGLYGKLPTHGDFLRRRVADDFVTGWDSWLQQCMADSRAALGDAWLDTYLTSPVWRFALMPRVCGAAAVAGLLVPSVDRVGRYFPLTLVWPTPSELTTLEVALLFRDGFEHAERLLIDTLASEHFEFAEFDRSVMDLAAYFDVAEEGELRLTPASARAFASPLAGSRCVPLREAVALGTPALQLLGHFLESNASGAVWWTDGSAAVAPSWLMTRGLPESAQFNAMLDGAWAAAGWQVAEVEPDPTETIVRDAPSEALAITSAAHSDRGSVRTTNQDAFLERPDLRLWAVADGMGGLQDGDVASRMVCDALAGMGVAAALDDQIEVVMRELEQVNEYLRRSTTREINPIHSGTTIVALLIRDRACAVVWAGDSRAYRLRGRVLTKLTTDHSWEAAGGGADEQAITRAVGGEDSFVPDTLHSDVRAGDRYLLCSDGIYRAVDDATLRQLLQIEVPATCCRELVAKAIALGATDNVTVVVVDCASPEPSALVDSLSIVSL